MNSDLITTSEAAEILGVTPARVRQFVLDGRLNGRKVGRDLLLDESEVRTFAAKPRKITGRPKIT
jgi:excisionase family DNA binding protein